MKYPLMFRLGQKSHSPTLDNVPKAVNAELSRVNLGSKVKAGNTVAITCGSHRIANYAAIVKAAVDHFKVLKTDPFLVPAMGSDGGGTAEGQTEKLRALGVTEELIGAEIRSSMETEIIGRLPEGVLVHCDKQALTADHILIVNRVRLHPIFHNEVQSGLLKMMAIGLGKANGARICHKAAADYPFDDIARGVHKLMVKRGNLLAGLMIVENDHEGTARIQAALPEDFIEKERFVLQYSRGLFSRLPFRFIDVLFIDEIGTTFSCLGADSNVTGRKYNPHAAVEGEFPQIRTIAYRDLNPQSNGNAIGVGHAEFVRSRLLRKIDANATRRSALMHGMPTLAAAPVDFESDQEILDAAIALNGLTPPEKSRIVWIRNTTMMHEMECSEPYLEEVKHWKHLPILSGVHPLDFDSVGNLRNFAV